MGETYAAPMSFVGATRRLLGWGRGNPVKLAAAVVAVPISWMVVAVWYVVVFGLFAIITIPFRLIRRSQRKTLALQRQQLEELKRLQR
jgi:hypothetical protein